MGTEVVYLVPDIVVTKLLPLCKAVPKHETRSNEWRIANDKKQMHSACGSNIVHSCDVLVVSMKVRNLFTL